MVSIWNRRLCIAALSISAGCTDSGNDHRVAPSAGENPVSVVYDAPNSGPSLIQVPEFSLKNRGDSPQLLDIEPRLSAKKPLVFEGAVQLDHPPRGNIHVEFFQKHPKLGRIITNEANGSLVQKDGQWTYRIAVDAPADSGRHQLEVQFRDMSVSETESRESNQIIAVADVIVTAEK